MAYNIAPSKQDLLVSGNNIKTINSTSILGSGDIVTASFPTQTGNGDKVLVTNGSAVSWQFAGLGAGAFGTNNVILGRAKPTSFTTANANIIINTSSTNTLTTAQNNVIIGTGAGNTVSTGNRLVLIGTSAATSIAGSERGVAVGANTQVGTFGTAIGESAIANGERIAIGCIATTSSDYEIAIGVGSITSGGNSVAIGSGAGGSAAVGSSTAIGAQAKATATSSVALGRGSVADVTNSFALGSSSYAISTLYLGYGGTGQSTAAAVKIMTMRPWAAADTDLSAGTLTLAGSQSTGNKLGGDVILSTSPAGAGGGTTANAHVERMRFKAATEVVVNDTGVDFDFRVEGDTDQNLLFVDASTDRVGIGTATPAEKLEVNGNLKVTTGDVLIATAGKGLSVKSGTNAKIGVTTAFPGGGTNTVTVSTTAVTANSIIFISAVSGATTIDPKVWVSTITAGASFVISSGDNSFVGTVGWMIVEQS